MSTTINGTTGVSQVQDGSITPADLSQPMTLGTAQNTTSGVAIDFTGIPAWVKRITVMLSSVSTSGTSRVQVQLGSGTIDATGYASQSSQFGSGVSTTSGSLVSTTGFVIDGYASAIAMARSGSLVLALQNTNIWVAQGVVADTSNTVGVSTMAGAKTLSGALDRIRITTVNGTDTFDAGSVNILYEG